jgi:hypothetical protein
MLRNDFDKLCMIAHCAINDKNQKKIAGDGLLFTERRVQSEGGVIGLFKLKPRPAGPAIYVQTLP